MLRKTRVRGLWVNRLIYCLAVMPMIIPTQNASADDDFWKNQHVRTDWVYATLKESDVIPTLDRTIKDQAHWASLPENAPGTFHCKKLEIAPPSSAALAAFNEAPTTRGPDADKAYAKAASLGYWRAAARLVNSSLEDEYWEGAMPIVAWLLVHHVPAGYNKFADILEARSGYDGETPGDSALSMIASLRWRAAREGDPVAQAQMADIFDKLKKPAIAVSLRACATQQNPDLAR
ncbi:hypothetical protein [Paraburkholderia flava]|uniref:hypothetical protein n=1 Tax=Paraburkholderia flava TaxID=2547393 RepID=UPI0010606CCF|nr:hypothetical protein [Paraburkholderia flava]